MKRFFILLQITLIFCFSTLLFAADQKHQSESKKPSEFFDKHIDVPYFSQTPRLGYAFYMPANLIPGVDLGWRHAFVAGYGFNFGGTGFSSEFTPLFEYQDGGKPFGDIYALGLYAGVNWRWRWWNFVPSAGFGVKSSYLFTENADYGIDLYGRIPLSLTWYLTTKYNIIFELGFSFGVTGIKAINLGLYELHFGHSFSTDVSVGSRF